MPRQIKSSDYDNEEPQKLEPRYVTDEELRPRQRPKWTIPKPGLQKRILGAVHREYYHSHEEASRVIQIEKWSISLTTGLAGRYPLEWVEFCIKWAEGKWMKGELVSLAGLCSFIEDSDARIEWVVKWQRENKVRLQQRGDE